MTNPAPESLSLNDALQRAVAHHRAGRLAEAATLYQAILQGAPAQPDANHNLAVLALQAGQPAQALPYFKAAVAAEPARPQFWISYLDALVAGRHIAPALRVLGQGSPHCTGNAAWDALAARLAATEPQAADEQALIALFQAGRHAEAEEDARTLLAHWPDWGPGWKVLGAVLKQAGTLPEALAATQRAAELLPGHADVHSNLGDILRQLGQAEAAVESCRRAIALMPGFAQAHNNLGNALNLFGEIDLAEASYRRAIAIKPDHAGAHANLGRLLLTLDRLPEAEASLRQAIALQPNHAEAHNNLGSVQKKRGHTDEAAASFRQAVELAPQLADAHSNLGNLLRELGQMDQAVAHCRTALALRPDFAEAWLNLGSALRNQASAGDVLNCYERALQIDPLLAPAHNAMGTVLLELRRFDAAQQSLQRAIELDPANAGAHCTLGLALMEIGKIEEAHASMRRSLEHDPDFLEARGNLLFVHNLLTGQEPAQLLEEARRYGAIAARQAQPYRSWLVDADPERCLRIGFVSGDLRTHPVAYFIDAVLENLARDAKGRLEIVAYATHATHDAMSARLKEHCAEWHDVPGLTAAQLAALIHSHRIDIAIDLSGHTAHNRLPMFAWKPAPVQASWLGYMSTTGIAAMDYVIADPHSVPPEVEASFSEKIWRLPDTCLCFTEPDVAVAVSPLPALANGYLTFGSFNNLTKINDSVIAVWSRVLHSVPRSRLLLKTRQFDDAAVREDMAARFAAHGIPVERLIIKGYATRQAHFESYHRIDIALDPFPYPGVTTTTETLWMGVPVLTMTGKRMLPRLGVGILTNAGLPDWIARDEDDYVDLAAAYAADLEKLVALRRGLRAQVLASPMFDARRFAGEFEKALRGMWRVGDQRNWADLRGK